LRTEFPGLTIEQVPGNCDVSSEVAERILIIEGKRVLICHGHTYHVKSGYLNIQYAAMEKEVDVVLFGHTHQAHYDYHNGLVLMNPGSVGLSYIKPASYGWLYIDTENDRISVHVEFIE
jgi:putative phosphoesterase